ncbi:MAG: hypothetical protein ABG776_00625 [Cyanobacteria bacterium J06555_13]
MNGSGILCVTVVGKQWTSPIETSSVGWNPCDLILNSPGLVPDDCVVGGR